MTNMIVRTFVVLSVLPVFGVNGEEMHTTSLPSSTDLGQPTEKSDDSVVAPQAESPEDKSLEDKSLEDTGQHPLERALQFAGKHDTFIRENVRDFSCVLAKRELLHGRLHDYEYLRTIVRREQTTGERTVPYSVYAEFLSPKKLKGRRVLYVEGRNENKMLVRKGGPRFGHVVVNIAPTSDAALRESRYPITELGLSNVVRRLLEQAKLDMIADPEAKNTEVVFYRNAKIDSRTCTHIRVTHSKEDDVFTFHQANIYVDDELNVPLRVETYLWPKKEGEPPVLLEEYTYMKLKLNVGLTDDDFSEERVRASAK
jgi:Protein of unknown function (DUF1571)